MDTDVRTQLLDERDILAQAENVLERKQKSRIWFGAEVDLLNDICKGREILQRLIYEINLELARGDQGTG